MLDCAISLAVEAGLPFISTDGFPCDPEGVTCITLHFFTNFLKIFTSDTITGKKGIFSPVHTSRKMQVPAVQRALADIRSMYTSEDSAGGLSDECQEIHANTGYRRLPITKKSVERKDGGVVTCLPVHVPDMERIPRTRFYHDCFYQDPDLR